MTKEPHWLSAGSFCTRQVDLRGYSRARIGCLCGQSRAARWTLPPANQIPRCLQVSRLRRVPWQLMIKGRPHGKSAKKITLHCRWCWILEAATQSTFKTASSSAVCYDWNQLQPIKNSKRDNKWIAEQMRKLVTQCDRLQYSFEQNP